MAWGWFRGLFTSGGTRQEGLQVSFPSYATNAAAPVTVDTALQVSAVWACVRLLSESIASLPINVYRVENGVKTKAEDHPLSIIFDGKVNRWQNRMEFFETMTWQLALLGNAYAIIQRNNKEQIVGLLPLMSQQMEVKLLDDGTITYQYTDGTGVTVFSQKSIWHVKLMGNGIIGMSPLAYARNSIGIAAAAENRVSKIYSNGAKPAGVLMIDRLLSPEQRKKVKDNFRELSEGDEDRLFVLEADMKYQQVSMSPQDIELLASRRFQIEDICRFFGVPSVLVNDREGTTVWGSGIQQIVQGFYKLGLRPYLERYEASMKQALLTPEERRNMEIEFDFNALTRPDRSDRITMLKEAVTGGLLTANEARREEGMPPVEGGDELYMQAQMVPLRMLSQGAAYTRGTSNESSQAA